MSDKKMNLPEMSYRQWLIGMALQGLLASDAEGVMKPEKCAASAIKYVDALLAEMEGEKPKHKVSDTL